MQQNLMQSEILCLLPLIEVLEWYELKDLYVFAFLAPKNIWFLDVLELLYPSCLSLIATFLSPSKLYKIIGFILLNVYFICKT